jgi:hypothetical protein
VLTPGAVLAIAIAAMVVGRQKLPTKAAFNELRAQLDADAQALRMMGARS